MSEENDDDPDFPVFAEGRQAADRDAPRRDTRPPEGEVREDHERRRMFERTLPDVFRRVIERAVEAGVERLSEAPENIRDLVAEMRLPKEASGYVYDQIDDTKKGIYKIVAKEIRDVLEHINFADEIADVLTKLQFEVNTTIRFVPNDAEDDEAAEDEATGEDAKGGKRDKRPSRIPRPRVVSKVVMKAKEALKPKD